MMRGLVQPVEFGLEGLRPGTVENGVYSFVLTREDFFQLATAGGKNIFHRTEVLDQCALRARAGAGQVRERQP